MNFDLINILSAPEVGSVLHDSQVNFLRKTLGGTVSSSSNDKDRSMGILFVLLNYSFSYLETKDHLEEIPGQQKQIMSIAYELLKGVDINDPDSLEAFSQNCGMEGVDTQTLYYFFLATFGVLSKNHIKSRIELNSYRKTFESYLTLNWEARILHICLYSLTLLIRKKNGLEDIQNSIQSIEYLKTTQKDFESNYLGNFQSYEQQKKAYNLLGLYHLSKILTETGEYILKGYEYEQNLNRVISRHAHLAKQSFGNNFFYLRLVGIIYLSCLAIQKDSIWFQTKGLGTKIESLCRKLSESKSILDLLPSQQEALAKNLMDPFSNVAILQMPTSAGKTLLAELRILQTLSLNPAAKIVYIVPTRTLVSQIARDLKDDFENVEGVIVEQTSKVNEIDPAEDVFLRSEINVLVSTPEKIDLLIRKKHVSVQNISLVIIDEAHNIEDGVRGARLELLLSIIKREFEGVKFMLLSPFIDNMEVLGKWLGGSKQALQIKIDWKPSDKVLIGLKEKKPRNKPSVFELNILPSPYSYREIQETSVITIPAPNLVSTRKKDRLIEFSLKHFTHNSKTILFLCWGPRTADNLAKRAAESVADQTTTPLQNLVAKYIEEEIGGESLLASLIKKGLATHHAGMTEDARQLVEFLIRKGEIRYVYATTTIAQGVNFPISSVFIQDTRKGSTGKNLSSSELFNIIGRAGRTLVDNVGKVIFPFINKDWEQKTIGYIQDTAHRLSSSLLELMRSAESIIQAFSVDEDTAVARAKLFSENPALASLAQYLIHLLSVSEEGQSKWELTELFKDSFGYHLLSDPLEQKKFIKICDTLYSYLEKKNEGVIKCADKTGFSVSSVLKIMHENKSDPTIKAPNTWDSRYLFEYGNDYLTNKIKVISKLPEVALGTDSDESEFNSELFSKIMIGWVKGKNFHDLSVEHPMFVKLNAQDRINKFVSFMTKGTFKASWGLSALEGIVKGGEEDVVENSHIPSMIYYGVGTREAIAMRMLGVPRDIADNVGQLIYSNGISPNSYQDLRSRLRTLSPTEWEKVRPRASRLNAKEWRDITNILSS